MISIAEYKMIADKIHEILDVLLNSSSIAVDMQATSNALSLAYISANPLINFQKTANEIDYFADINLTMASIEETGENITPGSDLSNLVNSLQQHILARYETVDDWLSESGILVKQRFYDLSNSLGYEISSAYLES